jgi:uncharacterized protein YyaL (SSP411 family)
VNRLGDQTSPYLRQHADNPVDWYPWGEEAFEVARATDRPILLSVGYSACHWCHVMAHESFEDPDTAAVMNELFVNIKVDREERPDVDAIYMDAITSLTGQGGWPMTVFLMPDRRPFFGGTYFPKDSRGGMPSFTELMHRVNDAWQDHRDSLVEQATQLTEALDGAGRLEPSQHLPGPEVLIRATGRLQEQYDAAWGGFGGAPKFPQTMSIEALFRSWHGSGNDDVLQIALNSLDCMASGGIYDHLGGGFSRYAVDRTWTVPHFEKMLYDNALFAKSYLHAWQITAKPRYLQVVTETIEYVLRDLRHDEGGFYSAEDADSEGVEGKFYVWEPGQIRALLDDSAEQVIEWYGVTDEGNFEGLNILTRPTRGSLIRPAELELARQRLFTARDMRVRPGLDNKVLTEWNGLMLAALAEAGAAAEHSEWLDAALANADFLCANLRNGDGRWLRSWQPGSDSQPGGARHLAYAADYAALTDAFTRLAEATGSARWITEARTVADSMLKLFWDQEVGGLFTTGSDADPLITRPKDITDNAIPSANSAAAVALLRLGALTGHFPYTERGEAILRLVGPAAGNHPTAFGHLLGAIDSHATGITEIAVVGDMPEMVRAVQSRYLPNAVLAWGEEYDSPLWAERQSGHGYVCRNYTCSAPVTNPAELLAQLD